MRKLKEVEEKAEKERNHNKTWRKLRERKIIPRESSKTTRIYPTMTILD